LTEPPIKPSPRFRLGFPVQVAVNPVTNRIYVSNQNSSSVTVIDGATNQTTTVPVGVGPGGLAVNSVANKIYVVNAIDNTATVIDGDTTNTTTVPVGPLPLSAAVNQVTNQIYVANIGL
jgi:YVTN family beta-propeller protein